MGPLFSENSNHGVIGFIVLYSVHSLHGNFNTDDSTNRIEAFVVS